jgi:uncharacterized membrane protein
VKILKVTMRTLRGLALVIAGTSHLTTLRNEFQAQVPSWLGLDADFVVVASGVVEICMGLGLIFLVRYQAVVGILTALFFVAIFPGNISQYLTHTNAFGLNTDEARLIRLFFQPVLAIWALYSTNSIKSFSRPKS